MTPQWRFLRAVALLHMTLAAAVLSISAAGRGELGSSILLGLGALVFANATAGAQERTP